MQWPWQNADREGPGIDKDAPRRTGLPLLAETAWREAWELVKLNLLIVAFSLPVITIPATHAAATRIAIRMVRDENVYLLRDFWAAFTELLRPASLAGLLLALALAAGAYAVWIYGQLTLLHPGYALPLTLAGAVTLFLLVYAANLFTLLARADRRLPAQIRLALTATLIRPWPVLAALAFTAGLWLAHVLFYPVSVFMPAVMNFSLSVLALTFAALGATDRALALQPAAEAGTAAKPDALTRRQSEETPCET